MRSMNPDRARLLRIKQGDQPALFVRLQMRWPETMDHNTIQEPAILPKLRFATSPRFVDPSERPDDEGILWRPEDESAQLIVEVPAERRLRCDDVAQTSAAPASPQAG